MTLGSHARRVRELSAQVNAELDHRTRTPVDRDPPTRAWATSPVGAVVLTVAGIVLAILIGSLPALAHQLLWGEPEWVTWLLRGVGVTAAAIAILYRVRHTLARQTLTGLGLDRPWRAGLDAPVGITLGFGVVATADQLAVWLGIINWRPADQLTADLTAVALLVAVLIPLIQEAVPEELWFRGHLYDTLSRTLRPGAVIVLTTVVFGVLHIVSDPPEGLVERLLYVVMATAFGLLLTAGRALTGALWLPIGLHAGHNAFMHRLVDLDTGSYSQLLAVRAATMTAVAMALLAVWRMRRPARARSRLSDPSDSSDHQ